MVAGVGNIDVVVKVDRQPPGGVQVSEHRRRAVAGEASLASAGNVVITPPRSTLRMRWLAVSAMKRLPKRSMATPRGYDSAAPVAGPPSPSKPLVPEPAMVLMVLSAYSFRTRLLPLSAIYRLP